MFVKYLNKETYIDVIYKTINTAMFQNMYAIDENNNKVNITENGNKSCAFYVSFILAGFKLIDCFHATVDSTVKDMLKNNWVELSDISDIDIGDVIVWDKDIEKNIKHKHIGFYAGDNVAISNISEKKLIGIHHFTYGNSRKIEKILRYDFDKK